ncbi:Serine/threonine-protein kinase wnk3 [Chytriomyces hyalinus]|nr:Serine/threonine-protein kinase wnk3 [Chytriomyces hyalinus]
MDPNTTNTAPSNAMSSSSSSSSSSATGVPAAVPEPPDASKITHSAQTPTPARSTPNSNSPLDDEEDEENRIAESDPTGRFARYNVLLGKGAYKEVYKAFDEDEGVEVAWNQLRVDHLAKREAQRILSEIQILKSLRNDHIITMYHAWGAKGPDGRERVFFITELMTAGTLKAYLKKSKGPARLPVLKKWARQILHGLNYLHSRSPPIIHRDLKCENIFMNGYNGQAKIGDLGLAIPKSKDHASSVLGTPEFMAPELYEEKYDEKVDIYAFGMVVLEMVTKEYPYSECTNQYQIFKKVTAGVKPMSLAKITDPETLQFIELCIQYNPAYRPAAGDLLAHPFLKLPDAPVTGSVGSLPIPGVSATGSNASLDGGSSDGGGGAPGDSVRASVASRGGNESLLGVNSGDEGRYMASPHTTLSLGRANVSGVHLREPGNTDMTAVGRSMSVTSIHSNDSNSKNTNAIQPKDDQWNPPATSSAAPTAGLISPPMSVNGNAAVGLVSANSTGSLQSLNASSGSAISTVVIELCDRHSESTVTLRMVYTSSGNQTHEIKFPFNLPLDTATDVVSEMVKENLIEARDEVLARRKLEEKVKGILLGRVEESSRRASELPPQPLQSQNLQFSGFGSDTSLRDNDRERAKTDRPEDAKFATMPRISSNDAMRHSVAEKPYSTMPRANSSLSDLHQVPRTLSNTSLSSSTSSGNGAPSNDRYMPHITPSSSPQPAKKIIPQSQLQQMSSVDAPYTNAPLVLMPSRSTTPAFPEKATFSLSQTAATGTEHAQGQFAFDESQAILPSSSISEGYKRGQSGSSVASSDYALSTDGTHVRRASHFSQASEGSHWGNSSVSSDSLHPGNGRPLIPPERSSSVGPQTMMGQQGHMHAMPAVSTNAQSMVMGVLHGPINNPSVGMPTTAVANSANSANVQQRLLELQERSLKDLGSGINNTRNNSVPAGGAAPHINHHAVHHLQHHHHSQFHPHHASSYSGANNGNGGVGGVRSSGWSAGSGAGAGLTTTPPNGVANRPMGATMAGMGGGNGLTGGLLSVAGSKPASAAGTPPLAASPSLGGSASGANKIGGAVRPSTQQHQQGGMGSSSGLYTNLNPPPGRSGSQ